MVGQKDATGWICQTTIEARAESGNIEGFIFSLSVLFSDMQQTAANIYDLSMMFCVFLCEK